MSSHREQFSKIDTKIFGKGDRKDWTINFPETLGEHYAGTELFTKVYDEITELLGELNDFDYSKRYQESFTPLSLREIESNFRNFAAILGHDSTAPPFDNYYYWIMTLDYYFRFNFEKVLPIIENFKKNIPKKSLLSMIIKDFSANRFRDIRNSLAHCNFTVEYPSYIFYSERKSKDEKDKSYIRKSYSFNEIYAMVFLSMYFAQIVLAAFINEENRRSH